MNIPKDICSIQTAEQSETDAIILAAIYGIKCFYRLECSIDYFEQLYKWDEEGGLYTEIDQEELPNPTYLETNAMKQLGKNFTNRVLSGEIKLEMKDS